MKLTTEQKIAVRCDTNLMLNACPGSGKTRVIISKLLRTAEDVRGSPRAVACITYTNAAVYEIESRLRQHIQPNDDTYYDIGTIHSFCLNHVFRPFCHLIAGYNAGFKVLTPESEEFKEFVIETCEHYDRYDLTYKDFDSFAQLRMDVDGTPVGNAIDNGEISPDLARSYWKRIRKAGFIDFPTIIYLSYVLLKKRPEILGYVSSRFAWILVDEFQDTTDLQVEILSLIASAKRTRFLLVGDPCQSIFRFAGARPDLAEMFASRIQARTDLHLSGNFRSSSPVVEHANLLYPRNPPMKAVGRARDYSNEPIWRHGSSAFEVITDYFLPHLEGLSIPIGQAAILAPTWYSLFPLGRQLRELGISIVGPGARPYSRNRLFAPIAEQVCGYLVEADPNVIFGIERSLFDTVLNATGRANFDIFSYRGRVVVFQLIESARQLWSMNMGAVAWLESAAIRFSEILMAKDYLAPKESDLFSMSVEEMKTDMRNRRVDLANLTITDLGLYAKPKAALKLSTIHSAKGREYRAVAMIDLHDGRIPHYRADSVDEVEESKRLFYVGVTRAEQYLLYVTDTSNHRNSPTRFLRNETGVGVC